MQNKLLPCPFCGSSEMLRVECESNEGEFYSCNVYCDTDDCNYHGPTGTSGKDFDVRYALEDAIEKWNTRIPKTTSSPSPAKP